MPPRESPAMKNVWDPLLSAACVRIWHFRIQEASTANWWISSRSSWIQPPLAYLKHSQTLVVEFLLFLDILFVGCHGYPLIGYIAFCRQASQWEALRSVSASDKCNKLCKDTSWHIWQLCCEKKRTPHNKLQTTCHWLLLVFPSKIRYHLCIYACFMLTK